MENTRKKYIIMDAGPDKGMRIFKILIGVLSFCTLYFLLVSAFPVNAAYFVAVVPGLASAAAFLVFERKKYVWAYILGTTCLYTALGVAIGFGAFCDGALSFWNVVATTVNANTHRGWEFASVTPTFGADFLFMSVCAVWLSMGVVAVVRKSRAAILSVMAAGLFVLFCVGLYPSVYAIILLTANAVGLIAVGKYFSLKTTCCALLGVVLLVSAICPCFFYSTNEGVKNFRESIGRVADNVLYGTDALPEGRLKKADSMYSSEDEVRLEVTLAAQTSTLYLKGYVGSSLQGGEWKETDKNAYVENGYQGLLNYVGKSGLPFSQYAKYSGLCGNTNRYEVSVKNVGANRKYTYAPYTAITTAGSSYYDMQRRDGVFGTRTYSYTVFDGDHSCERVTQALWIDDDAVRTDAMQAYLQTETEYRAFVYDTYTVIDERTQNVIRKAIGELDAASINTATQIIRAYFIDGYAYSPLPDPIGSSFIDSFFVESDHRVCNANAAYFASAATYIFRMYGFAARYVEGYLVHAQDVETDFVSTVSITGKSAHAWTEVYFDGIGWLPIEVTPTVFSDENADTVVDPETPDIPKEPNAGTNPDAQPAEPPEPVKPDQPIIDPPVIEPQGDDLTLLLTVKILLTLSAVALGVVLILLGILARREYILRRKRKALKKRGAEFGRAVYAVVERDCKPFGGFSEQMLAGRGIAEDRTGRFVQLIEKSVYGGYTLSENERLSVTDYIEKVSSALLNGESSLRRFVCKYIHCIGI